MEVVALFCPKCGGKINLPEGKNSCYCGYCGSQLVVDDGSRTVTYRTVDEARIRESDNEIALEMKKLELEEAKHARKMKALKALAIACAALIVLALIVSLFDKWAGLLIGEFAVVALMFGAMMLLGPAANRTASDEDYDAHHYFK